MSLITTSVPNVAAQAAFSSNASSARGSESSQNAQNQNTAPAQAAAAASASASGDSKSRGVSSRPNERVDASFDGSKSKDGTKSSKKNDGTGSKVNVSA